MSDAFILDGVHTPIGRYGGGPRFAPPQILRDKMAAGDLGRKTGKGLCQWSP